VITAVSLAQAKQLCHVDAVADDRKSSISIVSSTAVRAVAHAGKPGVSAA